MATKLNVEDIMARYQAEQRKANEANEARYSNLLDVIRNLGAQTQGTYDEALSGLTNISNAARQRVEQGAIRNFASADQDLTSRGLGNTTIRESVRRGVSDDAELQQQQIDESVSQQRSGLLQNRTGAELQVGGMLANAIQSRNDIGPDLSMYANLLQQLAAQSNERLNVAVGRGLPPGGGGGGGGIGMGGSSGGSWIDRARGQGGAADPNANRVRVTTPSNVQGSSGAHEGVVQTNPGQQAAADPKPTGSGYYRIIPGHFGSRTLYRDPAGNSITASEYSAGTRR